MKKLQESTFFNQCTILSFHGKVSANFYRFIIGLFCTVFTKVSAQAIPEDYSIIIKTNIFNIRIAQQWTLTLESATNKPKQTNNYTLAYFHLSDTNDYLRQGAYAMYERRFYAAPLFHHLNLFIAPYGKIVYRDINENGNLIFRERSFQSLSVAVGGNIGLQSTIFKRMSIGLTLGLGIGLVLKQLGYGTNTQANAAHLDGQAFLQLGYIF